MSKGINVVRPSRRPLARPPQDEEGLRMPSTKSLFLRSAVRRVSKDARSCRKRVSKLSLTAVIVAAALISPCAAAESPWRAVRAPSVGNMQVIGGPANGCIAGAAALPADGPGFSAIRISRNRFYGHRDTIDYVERLGRAAQAAGLAPFYVGDMAQPRGGPMPSGHGSHMNGMDVDIWFNLDPKPALPPAAREEVDLPSMVLADKSAVDPKRFGAPQVTLLRLAAGDARVDRIFVNPVIKRALCELPDHAWLHKIRPWYGHDEHFHVRLSCPADSPACAGQPPVPAGDGCDASLDWWLQPRPPTPAVPAAPKPPKPKLPAACEAVLAGR
ncbi:MAG TPA: penicillin-insensitive murein endopeptidase [Stellaceae bacterium]|nr:penicillin-insensitive murein endopeptidase [Stellaceae bacterium]